jgi:hypothetical protein
MHDLGSNLQNETAQRPNFSGCCGGFREGMQHNAEPPKREHIRIILAKLPYNYLWPELLPIHAIQKEK